MSNGLLSVIVRGRDSPIDIPLLLDGRLVPSDGVTRCDLVFKREGAVDFTFSSALAAHAAFFSLQASETLDGISLRIIRVNLRAMPSPPLDGRYKVDVFLWDADFTNGRLWGTLDVEVRPAIPVAA